MIEIIQWSHIHILSGIRISKPAKITCMPVSVSNYRIYDKHLRTCFSK